MRKLTTLVLFILITVSAYSINKDSVTYLNALDTVLLEVNYRGQKIHKHQLKQGQTLYSLAKFYGLSLERVYDYNPDLKNETLKIGQEVIVPIPNKSILRNLRQGQEPLKMALVFYKVKKGDTVYRIAKRYFKMEVEDLKQRNVLKSNDLEVGQKLFIGWMKTDPIPSEWQEPIKGMGMDLVDENRRNKAIFLSKTYNKKTTLEKGKAQWDSKDRFGPKGLFCLHKTAPKGSVVRIENPITQNVVYAKVIGTIPMNYDKWVTAVVSKDVAKALKAIDSQFFIEVEFLK